MFAMGLMLCLLYAGLAWVAYMLLDEFAAAVRRWREGQERKLMADWEREQMSAGSKSGRAGKSEAKALSECGLKQAKRHKNSSAPSKSMAN